MKMAGVINLNAEVYRDITLNYFGSNSGRLREFVRKNRIQRGEYVVLVGRSGRVRTCKHEDDGLVVVEMCEFDTSQLGVQVAVFAHFERRARDQEREMLLALREMVEKRLERQLERKRK